MKKSLTLGAIALGLTAVTAQAGGYTAPVVAAPVVEPVVVTPVANNGDWTGFYTGLNYTRADGDLKYSAGNKTNLSGNGYGVHAGYLHDMGQWVMGGELSYEKLNAMKLKGADAKHDGDLFRGKVMAGYDAGRVLPYVTLGAAHASIDGIGANGDKRSGSGWFAGIGAKFKVTDNVMIGAEIDKNQFKDFGSKGDKWDPTTIGLNVSYKF